MLHGVWYLGSATAQQPGAVLDLQLNVAHIHTLRVQHRNSGRLAYTAHNAAMGGMG